jgi:CRISPR/Cas system-associated endonuclease Cas3-HD
MIRFEEKIQQRAEKINSLISDIKESKATFSKKLDTFSYMLIRFSDTNKALLTGSGELELF